MSAMSSEQKKSRREWIKRLDKLVECTKLDHSDEDYMHPSDLIDEIIDEIPKYDISNKMRERYLKMLGVER